MHSVILALRDAMRGCRRRPAFFAIATLSLGVGLGLSTAVFAMIDALRNPLVANANADRLYSIGLSGAGEGNRRPAPTEERELLARLPGVEQTTAFVARGAYLGGSRTARRTVHRVSAGYLDVVGLRPARGRTFAPDDFANGTTAIVSDVVWRAHFDSRDSLAGATVAVDGRMYDVIGVLPAHAQAADVLIPVAESAIAAERAGVRTVARLRPGRTPDNMAAELAAVHDVLRAQFGVGTLRVSMRPLRPDPLALSSYHFAMVGAAIGILLIACANVAALMLARGVVGRRDQAVHLALGASPGHLTLRVFAEVAVLGAAGAAAGGLIAVWATRVLTIAVPEDLTFIGLAAPQWSVRVFALMLAVTVVTVAAAAAGPAWFASRTQPSDPLKDGSGSTTGRSASRFKLLVVAEMALSMVLVLGASLMAKQIRELMNADPGFDAMSLVSGVVVFPYTPDTAGVAAANAQASQSLLERVRTLPGVAAAAPVSSGSPDGGVIVSDLSSGGAPTLQMGNRGYNIVGTQYFAAYGVPVVAGRDFHEGDIATGAVVLSETAARTLFPREPAVGRLVKLGDGESARPWLPVVGVVRDIVSSLADESVDGFDARIRVYAHVPTETPHAFAMEIRAAGPLPAVVAEVRRALNDLAPPGSMVSAAPWVARYLPQIRATQYVGRLFTLLGAASLALAVAGLFSVLSYIVSQRMREFAVRMALGARRVDVMRLVVRDAMVMALAGTAIGALVGMRVSFAIWDLLGHIYPVDAGALVIAELTLVLGALAACALPAYRATRADPVGVMRAI